jgi:ubiquinone/menaquinone biosynthesis C-methylase UbiE
VSTQPANHPTPERIFNTINAHQQTAALKAAIDLDLFTAIADGANDPASLAPKVGAAERGVRILCDSLTILGFLTKQDGHYALTEESAFFLNRHSRAYLGDMSNFLLKDSVFNSFRRMTEAVTKGGTVATTGDNEKPDDDKWVAFAKSMAGLSVPNANFIAQLTGMPEGKPCKVLDIAAGHGMYGITMARHNPNAHITAADWPNVLAVAQQNAAAAGIADRYTIVPGSAFESDLGEGYDYILLTNIFHHFDKPTCERLMKRVHAALSPTGKAVILEFVPNEDRVSPPTAAMFSLTMLATTDRGEAYTFKDYEQMLSNVGFSQTTFHALPSLPEQVLISQK